MNIFLWVHVHICVWWCRYLPQSLFPLIFDTRSLTEPDGYGFRLTGKLAREPRDPSFSTSPGLCWTFCMWAVDQNSGPWFCSVSSFPTEPCPLTPIPSSFYSATLCGNGKVKIGKPSILLRITQVIGVTGKIQTYHRTASFLLKHCVSLCLPISAQTYTHTSLCAPNSTNNILGWKALDQFVFSIYANQITLMAQLHSHMCPT